MEYITYRKKLDSVLEKHKTLLFERKGIKHYWLNKDKIELNEGFKIMGDIFEEFKQDSPDLFYTISSNYYQYNCIFVDIATEDYGLLCTFWGFGIDDRLEKCREYFVLSDVVNHGYLMNIFS